MRPRKYGTSRIGFLETTSHITTILSGLECPISLRQRGVLHAWMLFGCDFEKKMRKYWNVFKDGCKGRDVSEKGRVMEESFVMSGILTSSAT